MEIAATHSTLNNHKRFDTIGVIASILCAIHCALTPVLLILLPTFGKGWAHPATHWGMAIIVIPIALFMMLTSYKKHAKKKVIYVGSIGIALIIVGAILPYVETSPTPEANQTTQTINTNESTSAKSVDDANC
jgi:hypothetical protein